MAERLLSGCEGQGQVRGICSLYVSRGEFGNALRCCVAGNLPEDPSDGEFNLLKIKPLFSAERFIQQILRSVSQLQILRGMPHAAIPRRGIPASIFRHSRNHSQSSFRYGVEPEQWLRV